MVEITPGGRNYPGIIRPDTVSGILLYEACHFCKLIFLFFNFYCEIQNKISSVIMWDKKKIFSSSI